ncbi:hypothetical protein, partial [Marinobacter sp.]|uniref:hypothetical protein n=1 Tax=Marinobacter sp. TaxID=50741 RepID=UPI003A957824
MRVIAAAADRLQHSAIYFCQPRKLRLLGPQRLEQRRRVFLPDDDSTRLNQHSPTVTSPRIR